LIQIKREEWRKKDEIFMLQCAEKPK
jgi:hypothetical protein